MRISRSPEAGIPPLILLSVPSFPDAPPRVKRPARDEAIAASYASGGDMFLDGSVPDVHLERGLYYIDLQDAVGFGGDVTLNVERVPVPGTALLMAMGLGVAGFARRRG